MARRNIEPLPTHRVEIRLAGSGGQGLILAGLALAEAVGVFEGREVAMVQSYGPEARGGASKAEVIVSDEPIDYPLCEEVDILLALNQEAADTYSWDLKPNSWIIVDSDLVQHPPTSRAIGLPFTATAKDKLKKVIVANIVALAAISEICGIVGKRSLEKAVLKRAPSSASAINKKALNLGVKMASDYMRKRGAMSAKSFAPEMEDF
jgi:2-oxoglutarate ferredoxin oxidoreductase subunit gamma